MKNNYYKRFNKADKRRDLLHLYKAEMSLKEITSCLHVGLASLYSKIKELGLKKERRYKRKTIDLKLFQELIKLGVSDIAVANKPHISSEMVIKLKKQHGYDTKDERCISKGKKGVVCRMYYKKNGIKPECPTTTNILENFKDDVINLLKKGTLKTEITKAYGVCNSIIFSKYNQKILGMRQSGMTLKQIVKSFGMAENTILYRLKKLT
ncbi:MAG: hypothetical protein IJ677_05430 [Alphaproteobacteria bacterium]|nr:hypothetical protein [Alphaproteobacteria bacterium]